MAQVHGSELFFRRGTSLSSRATTTLSPWHSNPSQTQRSSSRPRTRSSSDVEDDAGLGPQFTAPFRSFISQRVEERLDSSDSTDAGSAERPVKRRYSSY